MGNRLPSKIHPKLRLAVVQAAPEFLDLDGTIDKTVDFMKKAAQEGATLIAFPETWIPGYPWWIWIRFLFNRFLSPIVDGGQVYVPNYNGGVDVYAQ
jgi:predicted amidohydrolase